MVHVDIITTEFDFAEGTWHASVVASLVVDRDHYEVNGPEPEWVDFSIPIIDPETGGQVRFDTDPERWARLLPLAYRSGDVTMEVKEAAATPYAQVVEMA